MDTAAAAVAACARAFKEWAIAVKAIGEGRQSVILRKGGIGEGAFEVEAESFWLFPTYEHQRPEHLKEAVHEEFRRVLAGRPPAGQVPIDVLVKVEEAHFVRDLERVRRIDAFHVWSEKTIESRFHWGNAPGISVILLSAWALPRPAEVAVVPEYGGCKSWVDLKDPIAVGEARPVLPEAELRGRLARIRNAIG